MSFQNWALALLLAPNLFAAPVIVRCWPQGKEVCVDAPLRLTFDQAPKRGTAGTLVVIRANTQRVVARMAADTVSLEGTEALLALPANVLEFGETYEVKIDAGFVADFPGDEGHWKFMTKAAPKDFGNIAVATDGSADFCTVQGAIDHVPSQRTEPAKIHLRKGMYRELVRIPKEKPHIQLTGEDRKGTEIAFTNNDKLHPGVFGRALMLVQGDDFLLENLTVRNTTPAGGSQAEAIAIDADRCILRNADFRSYQDTLYLSGRVYVADCDIEGDVDYVWGNGTVAFERCELRSMRNGYIVQSRNPAGKDGYVFIDCRLTAASEGLKVWLARIDAQKFPASHVAFLRCQMGDHIRPEGWQVTGGAGPDLRFEETGTVGSSGVSIDPSKRSINQPVPPETTAAKVLAGSDGWNPTH